MAKTDIVRSLVEPLAAAEGADVYDVTFEGGKLSVAVSKPGGIDLDTLADISRDLGRTLDEDEVIGGSYTLEVTSPGLERPLRTPEHFAGAVGESVTVRTRPDTGGDRRVRGNVVAADERSVTVDLDDDGGRRTIAIDDIERARTTFSWGASPKPGGPGTSKKSQNKKARS